MANVFNTATITDACMKRFGRRINREELRPMATHRRNNVLRAPLFRMGMLASTMIRAMQDDGLIFQLRAASFMAVALRFLLPASLRNCFAAFI